MAVVVFLDIATRFLFCSNAQALHDRPLLCCADFVSPVQCSAGVQLQQKQHVHELCWLYRSRRSQIVGQCFYTILMHTIVAPKHPELISAACCIIADSMHRKTGLQSAANIMLPLCNSSCAGPRTAPVHPRLRLALPAWHVRRWSVTAHDSAAGATQQSQICTVTAADLHKVHGAQAPGFMSPLGSTRQVVLDGLPRPVTGLHAAPAVVAAIATICISGHQFRLPCWL